MNYLINYKLFENSSENQNNPDQIEKICQKYNIKNYKINSDGSVDVDGSVDLFQKNLTRLPLNFGKVSGGFSCSDNKLTTLEGSPKFVGSNFDCYENLITSLKGGPMEVGGFFDCMGNLLTDLKGAPKKIGTDFDCCHNKILTLDGFPIDFEGELELSGNPVIEFMKIFGRKNILESLRFNYFVGGNKIHESRFVRACDELGVRAPQTINGYEWV